MRTYFNKKNYYALAVKNIQASYFISLIYIIFAVAKQAFRK